MENMEYEATINNTTNGTGADQGTQDTQTQEVPNTDPANDNETAEAAVERLKAELEAERAVSKAEKAQRQNFLNAVYNARANAKSVQNGDHPERNVLQKKIAYSATNEKNQLVYQE